MTAKAEDGTRKTTGFAVGEVHLGPLGLAGVASPDPALRGIEKRLGPIGHSSPLFGDRVSVPVIPEVLSVYAGRSGGLGFRVNVVPMFSGPLAYLGRFGMSVYVTHPALAPSALWVLDKSDRIERQLRRWVLEPAKDFLDHASPEWFYPPPIPPV
jgi:hypothetical protein